MQPTLSFKFRTVDEYIATFPPGTVSSLEDVRRTIKEAAPEAEELISYNMPAFKLHGMLVFMLLIKSILAFTLPVQVLRHLKKNCQCTKAQKVPYNFL